MIGAVLMCAGVGVAIVLASIPVLVAKAPERLVRENVEGARVPAVLGIALTISGLAGVAAAAVAAALGYDDAATGRVGVATVLVLAVMGAAGLWDDLRGDERPRGFKGHLGAARSGRFTGGSLKLLAGALAGLAAGALVASGATIVAIALLVALGANLVNLFDRAPGRAGKVALLWATGLIWFAVDPWVVAAAGTLGALLVCLAPDLRATAMLGDAGANPLGAVLGLGTALATGERGRWAAVVVLVAINLASEKWSFSSIIESSRALRAFDRLGSVRK